MEEQKSSILTFVHPGKLIVNTEDGGAHTIALDGVKHVGNHEYLLEFEYFDPNVSKVYVGFKSKETAAQAASEYANYRIAEGKKKAGERKQMLRR